MFKINKHRLQSFFYFFKFLKPYRKSWFIAFLLSVITSLLGLVALYLMKFIIDDALVNQNLKALSVFIFLIAVIFLIDQILLGLKLWQTNYIRLKVFYDLKRKLFKHMQKFPFGWFRDKSTGAHIYKIEADADRIKDAVVEAPLQISFILLKGVAALIIIFYLNWKMAIATLVCVPFMCMTPAYYSRLLRRIWKKSLDNSQDMFRHLYEVFSRIHLIKVFGKESKAALEYIKKLSDLVKVKMRVSALEALNISISGAISKSCLGLIVFYGGFQVIKGGMTLGSLTVVMAYLAQLVQLQVRATNVMNYFLPGLVSSERIASILQQQPPISDTRDAQSIIFSRGDISFNKVKFGYRSKEWILYDLTFEIPDGSRIALVGASGIGKSTIINLLLKLYDVSSGDIVVGNQNVKKIKTKSLRNQIGVVLQQPLLWNDTIANNIRYGDESACLRAVEEAGRQVGLDDIVRNLPDGYNTCIGEGACKLSEGQRQKIAIARALLKKPKILILDEAMSAMDSFSEERIMRVIKALPIRVLIVVSHRLSTVMACDKAYFIQNSQSIKIDKPSSLIEKNRDFYDLFAAQLKQDQKNEIKLHSLEQ